MFSKLREKLKNWTKSFSKTPKEKELEEIEEIDVSEPKSKKPEKKQKKGKKKEIIEEELVPPVPETEKTETIT